MASRFWVALPSGVSYTLAPACVAQLDRVPASEAGCRRFESCRAHNMTTGGPKRCFRSPAASNPPKGTYFGGLDGSPFGAIRFTQWALWGPKGAHLLLRAVEFPCTSRYTPVVHYAAEVVAR